MGCQVAKVSKTFNKKAEHLILIEYCKRYQNEAIAIIEKLDHKYPNKFIYELRKDVLITGKLEVSLFMKKQEVCGVRTANVYSKSGNKGRFASENWKPLLTNIDYCFDVSLKR